MRFAAVALVLAGIAAGQYAGYTYSKGACRGGNSPGNNAGLRFYRGCGCFNTCNAQASCTGFVVPWSGCGWCETYTSPNARGDNRNFKCYMKNGGGGGPAISGYTYSKGACRGGNSPGNNAGLKFYSNRNCQATCNAQATCTGFVLPMNNSNWCETYTSQNARGDNRNYHCYMKTNFSPAGPAISGYTWSKGACRGGNSPGGNAGLRFYSNRNCQATCNAQASCTGFVLPTNNSNWCETYTSVNARGDNRNFHCYMKNRRNCAVGGWGGWGGCNRSCGGGQQSRSRSITQNAAGGGAGCPALSENRACNTHACPVHCAVGGWGGWGACNRSCGGGQQTRTRGVTRHAAHGGNACPALSENRACNTHHCPVHCAVGAWGAWGNCNLSCGGGNQVRTRGITRNAAHGGNACPALREGRACNQHACPVHCAVGAWGGWGACNRGCGGGQQSRTRGITRNAAHGGNACPALSENRACNTHACPVHCAVGAFGNWGACNRSCGGGQQTRTRGITRNAAHGGNACPSLSENRACNTHHCPINCAVGAFGNWGACNRSCGGGQQTRTRGITTNAQHGGNACPALSENRACNTHHCPINCAVGAFGAWGACSEPCGGGNQVRSRSITTNAQHGGNACPALQESKACNTHNCPVNCVQSAWSAWGACSLNCGGGNQRRTRTITTDAAHGGNACGNNEETRACNTQPCPVNCAVGAFGNWGACNESCGGGEQTRTRSITTNPANGGNACPALSENRACNTHACPINCVVSAFGEFGACTENCGGGEQTKTRIITTAPQHGGNACPALTEKQACNEAPCPVDCVVSAFGEWSECSDECGGGNQSRTRTVTTEDANGGEVCPALTENQACNEQECPIDCEVSDWADWSECTEQCNGGRRARMRNVDQPAEYGGEACPALIEEEDCNTQPCPIDCEVEEFGEWGECSEECDGGVQRRTRGIAVDPQFGGEACPTLVEEQDCNNDPCPIHCAVSDWNDWSECTEECGGGKQTRSRDVTEDADHGGDECPALTEEQDCNTDLCTTDSTKRISGLSEEQAGSTAGSFQAALGSLGIDTDVVVSSVTSSERRRMMGSNEEEGSSRRRLNDEINVSDEPGTFDVVYTIDLQEGMTAEAIEDVASSAAFNSALRSSIQEDLGISIELPDEELLCADIADKDQCKDAGNCFWDSGACDSVGEVFESFNQFKAYCSSLGNDKTACTSCAGKYKKNKCKLPKKAKKIKCKKVKSETICNMLLCTHNGKKCSGKQQAIK